MQDVHKYIEEYNLNIKRKSLSVFDDIITDMINYKKLTPILALFIRSRKLSDSNGIRTHNHLVHKRTLNYLAKLAK